MALIDRIFRDMGADFDGYVANHEFSATVWFVVNGRMTRAEGMALLGLDATDDFQLDELQAHYSGLSAEDKHDFHSNVESAGVLAEGGKRTRTWYKSLFEMS